MPSNFGESIRRNIEAERYGRKQIVKVRKERDGVFVGLWKWECQKCARAYGTSGIWEYVLHDAYTHAIMKHALPDHHARNHH